MTSVIVTMKILFISLLVIPFLIKDAASNLSNADYICVFSPYTPKSEIKKEVEKYATSLKMMRYFEPSMDDVKVTHAVIRNQKLILIRTEKRKNWLEHEEGCRKNPQTTSTEFGH